MNTKARSLGLALTCALGVVALVGAPAAHAATDGAPCVTSGHVTLPWDGGRWNEQELMCPLTKSVARIPVHFTTKQGSPIVGYVNNTARTRFKHSFISEFSGARAFRGPFFNDNWGATQADDTRHWGYVNEVYFAGGSNDEDDLGLLLPGKGDCSPCGPPPPWRKAPTFRPGGQRE